MMPNLWMVRGGRGGYIIGEFEKHECVAIGFHANLDLSTVRDKKDFKTLVAKITPDSAPAAAANVAAMLHKFVHEMRPGDIILSYDPERREYLVGSVSGDYAYKPGLIPEHPHTRPVKWNARVSRDALSAPARNTLGSTLTIFEPGDDVRKEVEKLLKGEQRQEPKSVEPEAAHDVDMIRQDLLERAHEFIKDRIAALTWDEMQELVASILRAMNYRTRVSPQGSDRGKDIVASPDGLGLAAPRIKVEVKHRLKTQIGSSELRSFIGGLRGDDRGLYVSTGGFTTEALYEAERASIPVTLLNLDDLAALVVQHYDAFDSDGRALVPLVRVLWPAI